MDKHVILTPTSVYLREFMRVIGDYEPGVVKDIMDQVATEITASSKEDPEFIKKYRKDIMVILRIPDYLTAIEEGAFKNPFEEDEYGYPGLVEVHFPASLTTIGDGAFQWCYRLTNVHFPHDSALTRIGDLSFADCALTEINFPRGLTRIGEGAFCICPKLSELHFPASLKIIGKRAFSGCIGLTEVHFPASLTQIRTGTFASCRGLTELRLPASLKIIGKRAFVGCTGLTELHFPPSLTKIGEGAFRECTGLTELHFPPSLTTFDAIERYAFDECTSLTDVYCSAEFRDRFHTGFPDSVRFHTL